MEILFTPSLNIIEPSDLPDFIRECFSDDTLKTAIEDYNSLLDDDVKSRHDIPADTRVHIERLKQLSYILIDYILMLQTEEMDCGHT